MYDTYTGVIMLPDGREVKAILRGTVLPAPDYWDDAPKDALTIEWVAGDELTTDEYNIEFAIKDMPIGIYLHEYVVEKLIAEGTFEYGYEEPADYEWD